MQYFIALVFDGGSQIVKLFGLLLFLFESCRDVRNRYLLNELVLILLCFQCSKDVVNEIPSIKWLFDENN